MIFTLVAGGSGILAMNNQPITVSQLQDACLQVTKHIQSSMQNKIFKATKIEFVKHNNRLWKAQLFNKYNKKIGGQYFFDKEPNLTNSYWELLKKEVWHFPYNNNTDGYVSCTKLQKVYVINHETNIKNTYHPKQDGTIYLADTSSAHINKNYYFLGATLFGLATYCYYKNLFPSANQIFKNYQSLFKWQ